MDQAMAKKKKEKDFSGNVIATNRKASHNFFLEERYEAGLVLEGWEVKSIRRGRANIKESYVRVRDNEIFLVGAHISPLKSVSTHIAAEPTRTRKLLLHRSQINRLIGSVERKGYTLVPVKMYWNDGHVKLQFALGKGKKLYDKRAALKQKDQERQRRREEA